MPYIPSYVHEQQGFSFAKNSSYSNSSKEFELLELLEKLELELLLELSEKLELELLLEELEKLELELLLELSEKLELLEEEL